MRRLVLTLCALFAATLGPPAWAGGVQVAPILISLSPDRGVGAFSVHNGRDREASFEIDVYAWSQEDGHDVLTPTRALAVAPSVFLAPPNGDQIVRLALLPQARDSAREQSYRVVLRELPSAAPQPGFRLLLEMSMPVFATPRGARGQLSVTAARDADGMAAALLANTGNAHLVIAEPAGGANLINPPRYLLAGAQAVRRLTQRGRAVQLSFASPGDQQPVTQSFPLDDAPRLAGLLR